MVAAGIAGAACKRPRETIVSIADGVQDVVTSRVASAIATDGYADGVSISLRGIRPIKIDGNPRHPITGRSSDPFVQARLWDLYDPARSEGARMDGAQCTAAAFAAGLREALERSPATFRILTGTVTSPTLVTQLTELERRGARWHVWEPCARESMFEATRRSLGRELDVSVSLANARRVLALDADFLAEGPGRLRLCRELGERRREIRLVHAGPSGATVTAIAADHHLPMRPSEVGRLAWWIAGELGLVARSAEPMNGARAVLEDLDVVVAGPRQPAWVHALALGIGQRFGRLVVRTPLEARRPGLEPLVDAMRAGQVDTLLVLDANPSYSAPRALRFDEAASNVTLLAHVGLHADETAGLARWHAPLATPFEAWSDLRAEDGTVSIVQPPVAPLGDAVALHELVGEMLGDRRRAFEIVRSQWSGLDDDAWRAALETGVVDGTEAPAVVLPAPDLGWVEPAATSSELEAVHVADARVRDGRFAHNGWLLELPKPASTTTWGNAIRIAPQLARRLGATDGSMLTVSAGDQALTGPAWIDPEQAEGTVLLELGYGHRAGSLLATGLGYDAGALRPGDVRVERASGVASLHVVQREHRLDAVPKAPPPIRVHDGPVTPAAKETPSHETLYAGSRNLAPIDRGWAMVIDLSTCIGCSACTLACTTENNVPVVGPEQIDLGRVMHWIRVDFDRSEDGDLHPQPVPCMHCEKAPCEVVCPVNATTHSESGLNEMTYNRCVGTRYCSNNCPYKVRRFNYLAYSEAETARVPAIVDQRNPAVTVRSRGVMEKCTYCVQRLPRVPGSAPTMTACQQACPTRAIHFGALEDPLADVAALRDEPHHYELLGELGTRPRTTYLGRIRNRNPGLVG